MDRVAALGLELAVVLRGTGADVGEPADDGDVDDAVAELDDDRRLVDDGVADIGQSRGVSKSASLSWRNVAVATLTAYGVASAAIAAARVRVSWILLLMLSSSPSSSTRT